MTNHAFSEDALVEESAEEVLLALDWQALSAKDESLGATGTLGRESLREVALLARLRTALHALNLSAPPAAISLAVDELTHDRVAMGPAAANREVHRLLLDGGVRPVDSTPGLKAVRS